MLTMGFSYKDALDTQLAFNPWFQTILNRIEEENYLKKELIV
jgi:hypothetical protein